MAFGLYLSIVACALALGLQGDSSPRQSQNASLEHSQGKLTGCGSSDKLAAAEPEKEQGQAHQPWMDSLRRHRIREVRFLLRVSRRGDFVSTRIESMHYLREYERYETEITDPKLLEQLRQEGLEDELRRTMLTRAKEWLRPRGDEGLLFVVKQAPCITLDMTVKDDERLPTPVRWPDLGGNDETNLQESVRDGDVLAVTKDLAAGVDVNERDACGGTALFYAAWKGNEAMLDLLLENGAKPNVADENGWTPLMTAVAAVQPEAVNTLWAYGAEVNAKNNEGQTALDIAEGPLLCGNPARQQLIYLLDRPTVKH